MKIDEHLGKFVLQIILAILIAVSFQQAPVLANTSSPSSTAIAGRFSITWGDSLTGSSEILRYTLADDTGQTTQLSLDEALASSLGGMLSFDRKYVTVEGASASTLSAQGESTIFDVTSITLSSPPQFANQQDAGDVLSAVSGSKPWISIMCKFPDYADEPYDLAFFQGMYANLKPGLDHYWREQSYNAVDISGSSAAGWYTLPHDLVYYNPSGTGGGANLDLLLEDCVTAANASVDFSSYTGINMMFNADFDYGWAWGGSRYMALDGAAKIWSVTWEPPWSYSNVSVIAHEMGHGFGLPHSSGAYGLTYDSIWDVMSDIWTNCYKSTDPVYGCLGQHTISFHKDSLGWIPPGQKYTTSGTATITLDHLSLASTTNYRMVQIPIGGSSTNYYTVEVRQLSGYDIKLPGKAVIIHEVDTTRSRPANVIDIDNNGNNADAGAMWEVGESFTDVVNGISVEVLASTSNGYQILITGPLTQPLPVVSNPDPADGANVAAGNSGQLLRVTAPAANSGTVYYDDDSDISFSVAATVIGEYLEAMIPYTSGQMTNEGTNYWYVEATNASGTTRYPQSGNLSFTVIDGTQPDLVVTSPSASDTTLTHAQIYTINATAKNQGTATAASTTLRYYQSTDATIATSDSMLATDAVASLVAGASSPESTIATAPSVDGTYWVGACVDIVAGESNTSNQCSIPVQITVASVSQPDLVVTAQSVSDTTLIPSQEYSINATAMNQGTATASSTTLRYYQSTDSTITTSDSMLATDAVASLAAGASSPESTIATAPSVDGTYWVGACVDIVAGETNTSNQCSSGVRLTVGALSEDYDILLMILPPIIHSIRQQELEP